MRGMRGFACALPRGGGSLSASIGYGLRVGLRRGPLGCYWSGTVAKRSARRPTNSNATRKGGAAPVSQTAPGGGGSTCGNRIAYPVTQGSVDAGSRERKQSALVGVWYAQRQAREAEARFNAERVRLREAMVAARDAGATVAEIAEQMGISRQGVYSLEARIRRSEERQ